MTFRLFASFLIFSYTAVLELTVNDRHTFCQNNSHELLTDTAGTVGIKMMPTEGTVRLAGPLASG